MDYSKIFQHVRSQGIRVVFTIFMLYTFYIGYQSWKFMHASFSSFYSITQENASKKAYERIFEWTKSRRELEVLDTATIKNPFLGN